MFGLSVYWWRSYGAALFFGTPFVMGTVIGYGLWRARPDMQMRQAMGISTLTLVATLVIAVNIGAEGVICLMMAFPLTLAVVVFGLMSGRALAERRPREKTSILFSLLALPAAAAIGPYATPPPIAREVFTSIEINAAPDVVWPYVIAFAPLPEPTDLFSKLGVAYPKSARIVGTGVGAVRYCEFSTGAFVEPITAWEPGKRLAFDVTSSPALVDSRDTRASAGAH